MASETGVLDDPPENVLRKGRLQPGRLFLVDLDRGRIVDDHEIKHEIATRKPYAPLVRRAGRPARRHAGARAAAGAHRVAAPPAARVRLRAGGHEGDPRADRAERRGGRRLDGERLVAGGSLRPQAAALLVLQAALRAGHEPADRLDPRGDRDERAGERRLRAQPARRDARARTTARDRQPDPARLRARAAAAGALGDLQVAHARRHLAGRAKGRRAWSARSSASSTRPTRRSPTARTS